MSHSHTHEPARYSGAFLVGILLNLTFVIVEVGYGLFAHSLALLADAGHNFSDVLGLVLAFTATLLVRKLPDARRTYGMRRTSILAALANALLLFVAVGAIIWEAVPRLLHPEPIGGGTVMLVAGIGLVINAATAFLFRSGRHGEVNVRGAFLHMTADAGVSLGVVLAGLLILRTGWLWLDPAISLVIALVILVGTWSLFRDSLNMALDAVPASINQKDVVAYLRELPGVRGVHDVHIWGISTTEIALTAHVVTEHSTPSAVLPEIARELHDRFGIVHPTIQYEDAMASGGCELAPSEVV